MIKNQILSCAPAKRKLNLEEYKKRREKENVTEIKNQIKNEVLKTQIPKYVDHEGENVISETENSLNENLNSRKCQTEVISVVKSLKENITPKKIVDPITEAKNKVLLLKERKKAKQIRIIDSTVNSKIERVTKLPPLIDIVKNTNKITNNNNLRSSPKRNSDYEELIIVSVGCNTDITIPPFKLSNQELQNNTSKNSCSLLKSSALLYKTFEKIQAEDAMKIAGSSLIASIQGVVVKKSTCSNSTSHNVSNNEKLENKEHGEDKIIMHLNKKRIRPQKFSMFTQTDILPEFLPLQLLDRIEIRNTNRKSRRKYRHRKSSFSKFDFPNCENEKNETSTSSLNTSISHRYFSQKNHRKNSSSDSSSCSESEHETIHCSRKRRSRKSSFRSRSRSSVYLKSRSRSPSISSSKSRHYSRIHQNHISRNVSIPAVEERRIVYVGRIEPETNKETLRKKFVAYGPIKEITTHYKDSGVKYGFVTYEKAEDAFAVIDSSLHDQNINMYDISFGGRRLFCNTTYADLDNAGFNTYQSIGFPKPNGPSEEEDSFETLLQKVKSRMNASKMLSNQNKM